MTQVTGKYTKFTANDLAAEVQKLIALETTNPGLLSRPLLRFLNEWREDSSVSELKNALIDGLDVDFTGTQWEEEWLANGKVCHCKACSLARSAVAVIDVLGYVSDD